MSNLPIDRSERKLRDRMTEASLSNAVTDAETEESWRFLAEEAGLLMGVRASKNKFVD